MEEFEPDQDLRRDLAPSVSPEELRAGASRALAELRGREAMAPGTD